MPPVETPDQLEARSKVVHVYNLSDSPISLRFNKKTLLFPPKSAKGVTSEKAWAWFGHQDMIKKGGRDAEREISNVCQRMGGEDSVFWAALKSGKLFVKEWRDQMGVDTSLYRTHIPEAKPDETASLLEDFFRDNPPDGVDVQIAQEIGIDVLAEVKQAAEIQQRMGVFAQATDAPASDGEQPRPEQQSGRGRSRLRSSPDDARAIVGDLEEFKDTKVTMR